MWSRPRSSDTCLRIPISPLLAAALSSSLTHKALDISDSARTRRTGRRIESLKSPNSSRPASRTRRPLKRWRYPPQPWTTTCAQFTRE